MKQQSTRDGERTSEEDSQRERSLVSFTFTSREQNGELCNLPAREEHDEHDLELEEFQQVPAPRQSPGSDQLPAPSPETSFMRWRDSSEPGAGTTTTRRRRRTTTTTTYGECERAFDDECRTSGWRAVRGRWPSGACLNNPSVMSGVFNRVC